MGVPMIATGVWAGLGESIFVSGVGDRDRDPARLALTLVGGVFLGWVAASCALILVEITYAFILGQAAHGLQGLGVAEAALGDASLNSLIPNIIRLFTIAADGVFWVVFVAFAAAVIRQPLHVYITGAAQVRWRLLAAGAVLSAAAMAPVVVVDRLFDAGPSALPLVSVSASAGDRLVYIAASLLLIPAAAAEELFFRGWLLRQVSAFLRRPTILIVVTALGFSALHFDFNPDAFLTRALMGAGFAYMTLRLGGIEFSTGAHAINNIMIVLFVQPLNLNAAAGGDMSALSVVEDAALVGGYVLITEMVARLPALRRLAGVGAGEVSGAGGVAAPAS
jgi:membrane protease YdiL (CAAX protease family)